MTQPPLEGFAPEAGRLKMGGRGGDRDRLGSSMRLGGSE